MTLSSKLREIRINNNMSQTEIANILKIARQTYNHYEVQEKIIPIKHLITIANYFNVSIDYIFEFTETQNYKKSNKETDLKRAGARLKEFRKEKKLTQVKLAEILNTTFSNIAFYEKGRNLIATPFLYTICVKYNLSADYLLGRTNTPQYLSK